MYVSYKWLNRHIDIEHIDSADVADILTGLGLEVEGVSDYTSVEGGLEGVIVGKVTECKSHPDADRLKLTKVNLGNEEVQIVCGAPNVAEGQTVAVATVGTTLYPDGEELEIKKAKIRGVTSKGMICAEDELNLGDSHDGIMVLPADYEIGKPLSDYIEIFNDTVYNIDLTPNRSDATHHRGIAKDLRAYFSIHTDKEYPLKPLDLSIPKKEEDRDIEIKVENHVDCPRYAGLVLDNVSVNTSPDWMQHLLKSIGITPKNNIVDITNFILHDIGQPLHAFDYEKIAGNEIRVQHLPEGTVFTTLDENDIELCESDLMICDGKDNGLCIAGVYGGKGTGVTESTNTLFLESAHFSAKSIRKSSMEHNLRTDAAKVFEKGSDPSIVKDALMRATNLIVQYTDAHLASELYDIYPDKIEPQKITVRYQRTQELLGIEMEAEQIKDILKAMNMEFTSETKDSVTVKVPTDKNDVVREVDVIEEILRIYGFDNITASANDQGFLNPVKLPEIHSVKNEINKLLQGRGFLEMMNVSLTDSAYYDEDDNLIHINNTSNQNLDILRPDMIISALETARYNINRKQYNLKFYEWGKAYNLNEDTYNELNALTIMLSGNKNNEHWINGDARKYDFYSLKSYVNLLLSRLGIEGFQQKEIENSNSFSYGLVYHRGPMQLVKYGKVKSSVCEKMNIDQEVFIAVFDWDILIKNLPSSRVNYTELNKYPSISRDLALVADKSIEYSQIQNIVEKALKENLSDLSVFDIYEDEDQIGENKRSIAIRMTLEDKERTMTDEDIDELLNNVIDKLHSELDINLR